MLENYLNLFFTFFYKYFICICSGQDIYGDRFGRSEWCLPGLRIFYERPAAIASGLRNGGTSEIIVVDGHGSWAMIPLLKTHDQFIEFQD